MKQNLKIFTESIILAAIPALGYWVGFIYELGYFNYFGLPRNFIEITLNSVLLNSLSVVGGLVAFLVLFDFIRRGMSGVTEALKFTLYKILLSSLLVLGFGLVFNTSLIKIVTFLLVLAGPIIFQEILWPLWTHRGVKGFGNKVAAAKKKDFEYESATDKIAEKIGMAPFLIITFIYFISIFSYLAGGYQAKKQEYFLTSESKPSYVLVRRYTNNWLALKVDIKSHEFHKTYELLPAAKVEVFSNTKIGALNERQELSGND